MDTGGLPGAPARVTSNPSWLIAKSAKIAHRLVNDALGAVGFRRYHFSVLASLEEFGPSSQADVGRACGIDRSDIVATVNELVERGLAERTVDPEDRRRNTVTITAEGRATLEQLTTIVRAVQDELTAPLSTEELATFVGLITRLIQHHTTGQGAPGGLV